MKEKKSSFSALFLAFITILVGWLLSNHFVDLVSMWNQAKAKVSGQAQPEQQTQTTSNESVQ